MQQRGTLRSAACCGWLILAWVVCARGGCVYPRQELAYCDMVDYKVYDALDVPEAQKKANDIGEAHIKAWRDFAQQRPKKKKKGATGRVARLPFCEQLIKATTCNLLMPPCDGDGSQRYRKPCKAFSLALQYGCNWTLPVGDLSFAEPPDCFELPIRAYMQAEYLDAGEIGADAETDTSSRADDVVTIAKLLEEEGHTEHAAFMYLQALRFRSDDKFAHLRTFAVVHGLQEYVKSLKSQLALAQSLLPATNKCNAMLEELNSKEIAAHKGPGPGAKIKYILQYKHMKGSQMFYETGVWYGETINGLKAHFERLVSIEISEQIAELARQRFKDDLNVEILTGDSAALLPSVLQARDRAIPAIFWLDGHFSGSRFETAKADMDTPILTELDLVLAQVQENDVVLIDDARLFRGYGLCGGDFGTECYPTIQDLQMVLCRRQPSWVFTVEDDLIRMHSLGPGTSAAGGRARGPAQTSARVDKLPSSPGGFGPNFGPKGKGPAKVTSFPGSGGGSSSDSAAHVAGAGGARVGKSQAGKRIPSFGTQEASEGVKASRPSKAATPGVNPFPAPPSGTVDPAAKVDHKGAFHIKL